MKIAILLLSCAVTLKHLTSGYSLDDNPFLKMINQTEKIYETIFEIGKIHRNDIYKHPLPKEYLRVLKGTRLTLNYGVEVIDELIRHHCRAGKIDRSSNEKESAELVRRSNSDIIDDANFYKALSRALKEEYKNEPIIQENILENFAIPTWLDKRREDNKSGE